MSPATIKKYLNTPIVCNHEPKFCECYTNRQIEALIAQGWGDTPYGRIPRNWMSCNGRDRSRTQRVFEARVKSRTRTYGRKTATV